MHYYLYFLVSHELNSAVGNTEQARSEALGNKGGDLDCLFDVRSGGG